jgi:hypothetical protein
LCLLLWAYGLPATASTPLRSGRSSRSSRSSFLGWCREVVLLAKQVPQALHGLDILLPLLTLNLVDASATSHSPVAPNGINVSVQLPDCVSWVLLAGLDT